jgi:hypothetical protein
MNDASHHASPILTKSLRILAQLAASDSQPSPDWSGALVSELAPLLPPRPAQPGTLLGPNIAGPGLRWHADQLAALCAGRTGMQSPAHTARRRYHARMLGYGLASERPEFRPLVTILLPVYNRAGPLVEAVQSCVDQSWRPIEILVVDDGSTDDVQHALRSFGDQVRYVRKPNGGVASARNFGLQLAQGDFIHFLDSDDLLTPTAIEGAVAAFSAVADAELCYGQSRWIDMRTDPPEMKPPALRELRNPIRSMIVEFAFPVPTVMIPRWRMLTMPAFEEDLRRSSDWRYWQALGFARIKAVGMPTLSANLRRFRHSLQATPHPGDGSHAVAVLRGLRDLTRHPHAWPYGAEYLNILAGERLRRWFAPAPADRIAAVLTEIADALSPGRATSDGGELSMLPMLAAMHGRIGQLARRGAWSGETPDCVYHVLAAAITRAIASAAPLSDRDIAFWTAEPDAPTHYHGLRRFFRSVAEGCRPDTAAALADVLLRRAQRVPSRSHTRPAIRLSSVLGARLAGACVARWMRLGLA